MENTKLIMALQEFQAAWKNLSKEWSNSDAELFNEYPFEESFDDYDVEAWVSNSVNELNQTS